MIIHGDCLEKLKAMDENSVDSVVTDPPYGWRFMGKAWDAFDIDKMAKERVHTRTQNKVSIDGSIRQVREKRPEAAGTYDLSVNGNRAFQIFTEEWAREAFRVLKPGGHMLVFCGPRTYHRMASGLEDAGFEIRDQLQWLFGSGFPKSMDISKAIDKQAGVEREVVGINPSSRPNSKKEGMRGFDNREGAPEESAGLQSITAPSTDEAKTWQGWGTALKPANEPICLARKPISEKTVAANVLKHGTGGLNIDASRVGTEQVESGRAGRGECESEAFGKKLMSTEKQFSTGRWPANLILDEDAAALLDEQSGILKTNPGTYAKDKDLAGNIILQKENKAGYVTSKGDSGGASRFFYVAKASKRERNAGLEGMPDVTSRQGMGGKMPVDDDGNDRDREPVTQKNHYPTVKPIKLMEYLIRLITPPNGTVLDPFMGSGSTGVAAKNLGFQFIGIEMNEEYVAIADRRMG